ncbi:hypothetical protein D3C77_534980 [compost metagenome]
MSAILQAAQQGLEELTQLLELVAVVKFAGVENHRLEFRSKACDPFCRAQVGAGKTVDLIGQTLGKGFDLVRQRASAQQHGTFDRPQATSAPPFQASGAWQAHGTNQAAAEVGIGEVDIAVAHVRLSLKLSFKVWTIFAGWSFEP